MPNGVEELDPEMLAEFLAQASEPVAAGPAPPVAPASTQFVSAPPVLLPPVNPPPPPVRQTFFAPPQIETPGAQTAAVMEQLRTQINAMKFKDAKDALNAATQFQATRAYQNDLARGVSQQDALNRWGRLMLGQQAGALPGLYRETRAPRTPTPFPGATNVYQVGPKGETLWSPPASTLPPTPLPAAGELLKHPTTGAEMGVRFQTGPSSGQVLGKPQKTASEKAQEDTLKTQMREAAKAITTESLERRPNTNRIAAATQVLNTASNALFRLETPSTATAAPVVEAPLPLPKSKAELQKDKLYQTRRGVARWDGENFIAQ